MRTVICPYCQQRAELVGGERIYPHRRDLYSRKFWLCTPCGAYVGTHKTSKDGAPLGRLADANLRSAKCAAHAAFDPVWKDGHMKRKDAYAWLANKLGIERKQCHIGMFDEQMCLRVVEAVNNY